MGEEEGELPEVDFMGGVLKSLHDWRGELMVVERLSLLWVTNVLVGWVDGCGGAIVEVG